MRRARNLPNRNSVSMEEELDAPQRAELSDSELGEDTETSDRPSEMRRKVVKGLFAAPAVMAVGTMPALASGSSPGGGDGKDDHHNCEDHNHNHHDGLERIFKWLKKWFQHKKDHEKRKKWGKWWSKWMKERYG